MKNQEEPYRVYSQLPQIRVEIVDADGEVLAYEHVRFTLVWEDPYVITVPATKDHLIWFTAPRKVTVCGMRYWNPEHSPSTFWFKTPQGLDPGDHITFALRSTMKAPDLIPMSEFTMERVL